MANKSVSKIRHLMIITVVTLLSFGLLYHNVLLEDLDLIIFNFSTLATIKESSHWLILSSPQHLQEYINSSHDHISAIFINLQHHPLPSFNATNIIILTSHLQSKLPFRSTNIRTIAYLLAIKYKARFIYELNPNSSFHLPPPYYKSIQHVAFRRQRSPFINIHPTFTANSTFHSPGLPKDELMNITQDGWSSIRTVDTDYETIHPLIQQQILLFYNDTSLLVNHPPVAVEPFTFAPFTGTNILFTYDAFWGLLLLDSKSDTWRSWWVQRLLWDISGHVVFASSEHQSNNTVENNNNYTVGDDADVGKLVRYLNAWKSSKTTLVKRIEQLVDNMVDRQFCETQYRLSIRTWLKDLRQIRYAFPSITKPQVTFFRSPLIVSVIVKIV